MKNSTNSIRRSAIGIRFFVCLVALPLIILAGCTQKTTPTTATNSVANSHDDHDPASGEQDHSVVGHGHGAGPHDGTIADWGGGKYHVEFTVDHGKTQATAYVLGADEKTANPIDAEAIDLSITDPPMSITLNASPQDSDPAGRSSRFVGTHEKLGVVQEYAGTLTGVIEGTPYSGDFKEEPHEDHDH